MHVVNSILLISIGAQQAAGPKDAYSGAVVT